MGILSRMSTIAKSKISRLLDNAENPEETLDYSYEQQLELLHKVKRGITEMVTSKRRIQLQADKVRSGIERLERQAKDAVDQGRDDLATLALQRKYEAIRELEGLDEQIAGMEAEQQKLTDQEQRLRQKVDAFKSKKEVIKAQYSAAQAQVRIGEALGGISEEMGDVNLAVQRAENKTEQMKAKAGAIDELVESGVLDGVDGPKDDIEAELAKISAASGVESELAALKARKEEADQRDV